MIDFTKAFDTVDHIILLSKLIPLSTYLHSKMDLFLSGGG